MQKKCFNDNWTITENPAAGSPDMGKPVCLPYDAMIHEKRIPGLKAGENSGFYPGGKYLYRKEFLTPESWKNQDVLLEMEGVYGITQIFLNGSEIARHENGFTGFYCSLNKYLRPANGKNEISILSDNTRTPNCRWYTGSGIYRDVNLYIGGPVHFIPDSCSVVTLQLDPVKVQITYKLSTVPDHGTVRASVYRKDSFAGAEGSVLAACDVPAGKPLEFEVPGAEPWSMESPNLYTICLSLRDSSSGRECEADTEIFETGFRTLTWNTTDGFRMNGRELKLRGACVHPDNGPIGAVELDAAEFRKVRILKQCGYNAIRYAHSPASKSLLRACDRLGMAVMDEFSDVWRGQKNDYDYSLSFDGSWESDVESMVRKDWVHPSVVIYCSGNEVYDVSFREGAVTGKKIADKIRSLDSTRPITNAINVLAAASRPKDKPIQKPHTSLSDSVDPKRHGNAAPAIGSKLMNIIATKLPHLQEHVSADKLFSNLHEFMDPLDIVGFNYGTHIPGQIRSSGKKVLSVHTETYPSRIGTTWPETVSDPMVLGDFMWTGWEYIGETGLGVPQYERGSFSVSKPYPCLIGGVGSVDLAGNITAQGAYTAAVFGATDKPYIAVHSPEHPRKSVKLGAWRKTDAVHTWDFPGYTGAPAEVDVYAGKGAAAAELYLNGQFLGRKTLDKCTASFTIRYAPGKLEAVSYDKNGQECGRDLLESPIPKQGRKLHIECLNTDLTADGRDAAFLTVSAADRSGRLITSERPEIRVSVKGPCFIAGIASGDPMQKEPLDGASCRLYYGRLTAVIRSESEPGSAEVTVSANGYESAHITLNIRKKS